MSLAQMTIRQKLMLSFSVVTGAIALFSLFAVLQLGTLRSTTVEIVDNWLPSVESVNQINTQVSDFRILQNEHVAATDAASMQAIEARMADALQTIDRTRQRYAALVSSQEEQATYDDFAEQWNQYMALHERMLGLSRTNRNEEADAMLRGESRAAYDLASADLEKLVHINHEGATDAGSRSSETYDSARNALLAAAVVVALAAMAAAGWLIRAVVGPMARAAAAADLMASGDLSQPIQAGRRDEVGRLLIAMESMRGKLLDTVTLVRRNADAVATASVQISQGSMDLSSRTEEQASALQQTAASMEQIQGTVRHNADNAMQADQLAQGANGAARRGGEVVEQVVGTMRAIDDASHQIVEIISVIDGIAFQTNILALNAAVEAARAGEEGRGFAVVAGEVRTLAQRSADAAKQIKDLINANAQRVRSGTELVGQAGQSMREIQGSIQRVTDIVAEISSASREQSSGVSQVAEAIAQMDQTTQHNAALVEESTAAADSLKQQARQLVDGMSVFRLGADGAPALPALTMPALPTGRSAATSPARSASTATAAATRGPSHTSAQADWAQF